MNQIEKLLNELCPEGVEFRELGEVVDNLDSKRRPVTKSARAEGKYPYYGANGIQDYVDDYLFEGTFLLMGEDGSVIQKNGTPVLNWATGKFWVNNHAHVLFSNINNLSLRYLYYYLQTVNIKNIVTGGTQPKLNQKNMNSIFIALPPVLIQNEIVKILDKFVELQAELQAELQKRKIQYHYYRNALLTFPEAGSRKPEANDYAIFPWLQQLLDKYCSHGVEFDTLGSVCKLSRGRVISKDYLRDNPGEYPVFSSQTEENGVFGKINTYDYSGTYITWTTDGAHAGSVFYRENEKFSITNVCGILSLEKTKTNCMNFKFLYHVLSIEAKKYVSNGMGNPKLMSNIMETIKIPIPPLPVQQKIVAILDKFDALVNDLTYGLPAEIKARRTQYEYYRNNLLSFKERSLASNH